MRRRRPALGLALAGGGPEGAIWEIGALRALDEAVEGLDLEDLDVYVGVSAGAFLAANFANGLTPSQMCRAIVKHEPGEHPFNPETVVTPAVGELVRRGLTVPRWLTAGITVCLSSLTGMTASMNVVSSFGQAPWSLTPSK